MNARMTRTEFERKNETLGEIGQKVFNLKLEILCVRDSPSRFAYNERTYWFLMADSDGRTVVYSGSKFLGEQGQSVILDAKIKDHAEWRGTKQTKVSHPKVISREWPAYLDTADDYDEDAAGVASGYIDETEDPRTLDQFDSFDSLCAAF